jgi:hypothetical protein
MQWVTKRCRLSWLTNSALLYSPNAGEVGSCGVLSQWVQLYTGAQINCGRSNSIFNLWVDVYTVVLFGGLCLYLSEYCEYSLGLRFSSSLLLSEHLNPGPSLRQAGAPPMSYATPNELFHTPWAAPHPIPVSIIISIYSNFFEPPLFVQSASLPLPVPVPVDGVWAGVSPLPGPRLRERREDVSQLLLHATGELQARKIIYIRYS